MFNNCTISRNSALSSGRGGGIEGNCSGVNTILYGNFAQTGPEYYQGYVMLNYSCCSTVIPGTGNITDNPMFVNPDSLDYNLQQGSPCIDTGDPNSPLDPDSTRADMGAFYFDQTPPSPLTVALTPYNPPIQIPANGGSFEFNIELANNGTSPVTFDIWTMVTLPDGREYGPIIGPLNLTMNPGFSIERDRSQAVGAGAPTGDYTYDAYVGDYPDDILDEDHFEFTKTAEDNGAPIVPEWANWGESFENAISSGLSNAPTEFSLYPPHPNPFNPSTTISFELREASFVSLKIYDIQGREVRRLMDGYKSAGTHQVVFDADGLSSGVYFAKLEAGEFRQTVKLLLMK